MPSDFLDDMVAKRTERDPLFPEKLAEARASRHARRLAERMSDPELKTEYERQSRVIAGIDAIVNQLDALVARDLSSAELARAIDKDPASVRRLTATGRPMLATVIEIADALDAVVVVPRATTVGSAASRT
jgi:hypothetical protein